MNDYGTIDLNSYLYEVNHIVFIMKVTLSTKNKYQVKKLEELAKEWGVILSKEEKADDKKIHPEKAWNAIKELKNMNAFADIEDPVAWQREQRKERNIGWHD